MISVLDYGMGNIGSITNMFKWIGVDSKVCDNLSSLESAQKLVLPGVGAFDHAMSRIIDLGMLETLNHKALVEEIPILGICLGMQLITRGSEEGKMKGLGWIPAEVRSLPKSIGLKIPHMGWNVASTCMKSDLTDGFSEKPDSILSIPMQFFAMILKLVFLRQVTVLTLIQEFREVKSSAYSFTQRKVIDMVPSF